MSGEVIIRIQDFADPSSYVCGRGRVWFRKHGLSWEDFKANGIDVEKLYALNDQAVMVGKVEQTARRRIEKEGS